MLFNSINVYFKIFLFKEFRFTSSIYQTNNKWAVILKFTLPILAWRFYYTTLLSWWIDQVYQTEASNQFMIYREFTGPAFIVNNFIYIARKDVLTIKLIRLWKKYSQRFETHWFLQFMFFITITWKTLST